MAPPKKISEFADPNDPSKKFYCSVCREHRGESDIFTRPDKSRNPGLKDCRVCMRKRCDKYRFEASGWSRELYDRVLEEQGGKCAIKACRSTKFLYADHDHVSIRPRGILCRECNSALGFLRENVVRIQQLADYVAYWHDKEIQYEPPDDY